MYRTTYWERETNLFDKIGKGLQSFSADVHNTSDLFELKNVWMKVRDDFIVYINRIDTFITWTYHTFYDKFVDGSLISAEPCPKYE